MAYKVFLQVSTGKYMAAKCLFEEQVNRYKLG